MKREGQLSHRDRKNPHAHEEWMKRKRIINATRKQLSERREQLISVLESIRKGERV